MRKKQKKGSALVITLLILGVILTIGMSISAVSLKERKSSIGSNRAVISYEAADNGAEEVLNEIIKEHDDPDDIVDDICSGSADCVCDNDGVGTDGNLKDDLGTAYEVELRDSVKDKIHCEIDKAKPVSSISSIKSVGISSGQSKRAVEVPIK